MGTVWRLNANLYPIDHLEYHNFRCGVVEQLATRFGCSKYGAYHAVDNDLPHVYSDYVNVCVDFDGAYSLGEKVFEVFKEYIDKYMKDGSSVLVSGWEDACGEDMIYKKGGSDDVLSNVIQL